MKTFAIFLLAALVASASAFGVYTQVDTSSRVVRIDNLLTFL